MNRRRARGIVQGVFLLGFFFTSHTSKNAGLGYSIRTRTSFRGILGQGVLRLGLSHGNCNAF